MCHTDGQQAHEKMFSVVIIREMQIKPNEISPHTCQNGYHQKEQMLVRREENPCTLLAGM